MGVNSNAATSQRKRVSARPLLLRAAPALAGIGKIEQRFERAEFQDAPNTLAWALQPYRICAAPGHHLLLQVYETLDRGAIEKGNIAQIDDDHVGRFGRG